MQAESSAFMRVDNLHASLRQCATMNTAASIREWLLATLDQNPDLTIKGWAESANVAPSTIHRALKPGYEFVTSSKTLNKLAAAARSSPPPAVEGVGLRPESADLPLIGPIQAGAWLMIDDTPQDDPPLETAIMDRRYAHAKQWLRPVRGDSMNERGVFPGDVAHIVDLAESGMNLNSGMVVEVTRTRDGGSLREITLKEVEITPEGIVLWPRSTNPKWRGQQLRLDDESGNDIEVQITGLLLRSMKTFL